jgi:hypothetical protein
MQYMTAEQATQKIKGANLDTWPRSRVLTLFKYVDFQMDLAKSGYGQEQHDKWLVPWNLLMNYIDPKCLIEYPFDDWLQIEDALGKESPAQPELFA